LTLLSGTFDPKFVDVVELLVERHQDENKGLGFRIEISVWHGILARPIQESSTRILDFRGKNSQ
jgi:hypothetical protein